MAKLLWETLKSLSGIIAGHTFCANRILVWRNNSSGLGCRPDESCFCLSADLVRPVCERIDCKKQSERQHLYCSGYWEYTHWNPFQICNYILFGVELVTITLFFSTYYCNIFKGNHLEKNCNLGNKYQVCFSLKCQLIQIHENKKIIRILLPCFFAHFVLNTLGYAGQSFYSWVGWFPNRKDLSVLPDLWYNVLNCLDRVCLPRTDLYYPSPADFVLADKIIQCCRCPERGDHVWHLLPAVEVNFRWTNNQIKTRIDLYSLFWHRHLL